MFNLFLILICLLIGIGLQKLKNLPKDTHVALNVVILYVSLPALTLISIPTLRWDVSLLSLILMPWIVFALAYVSFTILGAKFQWSKHVIGCLILCAGLGNTSFVGFPIVEALMGREALKYALLVDQAGTFLICSTLGIWIATTYSHGKIPKIEILKRVLVFPPFVSFVVALIFILLGYYPSGAVMSVLERFAAMLAPLALISVGLQVKLGDIKESFQYLKWGLGYKLIVAPIVIFVLYTLLGVPSEIFKVALYESAMAPMITASIVAASYGLQPRLAGLMVGVGVPLSLITLSIWYFIL
jgi:predicted permease